MASFVFFGSPLAGELSPPKAVTEGVNEVET